ncbi:TniQ family protein [Bermanella sp. R86510]|uniref:TniQ family protein n=1 Tax=unclassified Bermanella TaxID=2627862 RepID=UPI0037C91DBC
MNKLFPIPLMGKGTSEVESLPSYIARTSYYHEVSVGELVRLAYKNLPAELELKGFYFKPEALLQPNKSTIELVYILGKMASQPLEQSALVWLYKTLGRSSLEISKGYRWCPECFQKMRDLDVDPYIKLKWHLTAIDYCTDHNVELVSQCNKCACDQTTYNRKFNFSYCQQCGHDLSLVENSDSLIELHLSWENNGFDVVQLFDDMADVDFAPLPDDGVIKSLSDVYDSYWSRNEEYKLYQLFGRDELIAMLHKQLPIGLLVARRIAFKLGISIYSLLSGQALLETQTIDPSMYCVFPKGYAVKRTRLKRDHDSTLDGILKYLNDHHCPSLNAVCEANDISTGYLRHRYPELTYKIVERHREFEMKEHFRKIYKAQEMALQYFLDQKYEQYPKSRKQAYKEVRRETGLPKRMIEKAVYRAYNALYQ